jgi:hypothetical protein
VGECLRGGDMLLAKLDNTREGDIMPVSASLHLTQHEMTRKNIRFGDVSESKI